jgi:hypothetical protein
VNARSSLVVGASVVLGCLILGLTLSPPAVGQLPPAGGPPAVGRYQLVVNSEKTTDMVFVLDTTTGQCWHRRSAPGDTWINFGTPVGKDKK